MEAKSHACHGSLLIEPPSAAKPDQAMLAVGKPTMYAMSFLLLITIRKKREASANQPTCLVDTLQYKAVSSASHIARLIRNPNPISLTHPQTQHTLFTPADWSGATCPGVYGPHGPHGPTRACQRIAPAPTSGEWPLWK